MKTPPKHQRDDNDDADDVKSVKFVKRGELSSLSGFKLMPDEIKLRIVGLACRFDAQSAFNLVLVSRSFHAMVKPLLWRHVKLDKPSALAEFGRALAFQPSNGGLVRSIHLGPLSDWPETLWPRRLEEARSWYGAYLPFIQTSLTEREESLLPRWCKPGREWSQGSGKKARDCHDRAVADALDTAVEGADVWIGHPDDGRHDYGQADGCGLGQSEWTVGLLYLQAIFDLYLCEMRRVEDAEGRHVQSWRAPPPSAAASSSKASALPRSPKACITGKCGHYPHLLVDGFRGCRPKDKYSTATTWKKEKRAAAPQSGWGKKMTNKDQKVIVITKDQVKKHLGRRHSPTDHFEHPLFFTREDLRMLDDDLDKMAVKYDYGPENRNTDPGYFGNVYDSDGEWLEDRTSPSSPRASVARTLEGADLSKRDGVVTLARQILQETSNLESLSLTGFLFECLEEEAPVLEKLRCISLGSPHLPPTHGRFLRTLDLPALEKFRFCADYFDLGVAKRIGGLTGEWPSLRQVEWDFGDSRLGPDEDAGHLLHIIDALQGIEDDAKSSPAAVSRSSAPGNAAARQEPPSTPSRYVEARLHPSFVSTLLAARPERHAAWLDGLPVEGAKNRVCLAESKATTELRAQLGRYDIQPRQDYQLHRKECERWWEACARELDDGGKLSFK